MIFKSGDTALPSSWRPIAGQETMEKLFSGILADRLQVFAGHHHLLPQWQRATSRSDGCYECNLALDLVRDRARRLRTNLYLVWIDIHNAFGSVNRPLLFKILARFGLPPAFVAILQALYSNNVQLYDDGFSYKAIPEVVGVKQGDPLSPLLFSFYTAPALFAVDALQQGFRMPEPISITAFADDELLVAPTEQSMKIQLDALVPVLTALALQVNTRKCKSMSVSYRRSSPTPLSTEFFIMRTVIPLVEPNASVKYLGRPVDIDFFTDVESHSANALSLANLIASAHLSPWFKLEAIRVFVYSSLHYLMRVGAIRIVDLNTLDTELKAVVRRVANLPPTTPTAYIEGPLSVGCLGFPSLLFWQHAHTISQFVSVMNDDSSPAGRMARHSLFELFHMRSLDLIIPVLTARISAVAQARSVTGTNHWTPICYAFKAFRILMEFNLISVNGVISVRLGMKGQDLHSISNESLFRNLCLAVHRITFANLLSLHRGHVFKHFSATHYATSLVDSGWGLKPHEWQLIQRARLDLCFFPSRPFPGARYSLCRRCGFEPETPDHIFRYCEKAPTIYTARHDTILWRVVRLILSSLFLTAEQYDLLEPSIPSLTAILHPKQGITIYVNSIVPEFLEAENPSDRIKKPDIVFKDDVRKIAYIIDVRVVLEYADHSFEAARREKIGKYQVLADILTNKGYKVLLDAFLIGALGSFDPKSLAFFRGLDIPPYHQELCIRYMCSQVSKYACDVYYTFLCQCQ